MGVFSLFTETQAGMSYRAFPLSKGVPEGRGIQASVSMPAACFFRSFSLMRSNRRIKAASIGPPRGCLNA